MTETPTSAPLTAIMCDGLGWFTPRDYKRMLLSFDRIKYLLPDDLVEFEDATGRRGVLHFPVLFNDSPLFEVTHFHLDGTLRQVVKEAARFDIADGGLSGAMASIPVDEQRYSWQVVNCDGDFGGGKSLALAPDRLAEAQALLLNKFLLAADEHQCVPIAGKGYIHDLIAAKYAYTVRNVVALRPELVPPEVRASNRLYNPVAHAVVEALIPDAELDAIEEKAILDYKARNRELFLHYSATVHDLVQRAGSLPLGANWQTSVEALVQLAAWKEKQAVEAELRNAWKLFFKRAGMQLAGGVVSMGFAPLAPLGALTWASLLGGGVTLGQAIVEGAMEVWSSRQRARRHGLYFLMHLPR